MNQTAFTRKVKYEKELQRDIAAEVRATPGGEKILSCLQCGTCGSVCPLSVYMDYTPRRLIGMLREGFKKEVVESFAIWLCASCYECTVRCPAGIKVTDVMYSLKRVAIHEGIYPRRFPIPILAKEFMEMLKRTGRNNEFWLVLRVFLKTMPMKLLTYWPLGLRLLKRGRMRVTGSHISKPAGADLRRMLAAMQDGHNRDGQPLGTKFAPHGADPAEYECASGTNA
jgi:quinone-modifying oxidoreductase subunit QmoC